MSHSTPPPVLTPFERLQRNTFDVITRTMGYVCTWGALEARVTFQNPTEEMKVAGVDYDPTAWVMEYRYEDFPGLELAVSKRGAVETVTIEGQQYDVRKITRKFDGKTYLAQLQPRPAMIQPPPPPPPPPAPDSDPDDDDDPTP
jgi:hypothetical protein